ncbi:S-layer homology domain-containing protein [Alkalicoccus chagannorensis]|uniref:S-layer homology domain-containing protein n=1 Tax=Alkalicoccus chagannorensis TaxID=427072 RepID=UPI000415E1D4|nr:S-layer homology domain-containing protein [Alkalicoccus chagannorensis]
MKNLHILAALTAGAVLLPSAVTAEEQQVEELSNGVTWAAWERGGDVPQSIHAMSVNLDDPYTELQLSLPDPLNRLRTTTDQARDHHELSSRVLGAVNASFFETGGLNQGMPANLLIQEGELLRFGRTSSNEAGYNHHLQAFGMMEDGTALIDEHNMQGVLSSGGNSWDIDELDTSPANDSFNIYTPNHALDTPGENPSEFRLEFVVEDAGDFSSIQTDSSFSGTIQERNERNEEDSRWESSHPDIPEDGFVISVHGDRIDEDLAALEPGDEVELSFNIDEYWEDASYVLGSGPFLVKDGERHITMDEASFQSSSRQPRTAIGISEDGSDVMFVTVDGRQNGQAEGLSITELADHLIELGADRAINLDGGGSTTMAGMKPGYGFPDLINTPSAGSERAVSTTLQAVDTSPWPLLNGPVDDLPYFETPERFYTETLRGESSVQASASTEAQHLGEPGVKVDYDFTDEETGTAAAYLHASEPAAFAGEVEEIGMWVYGDGGQEWLRGYVYDAEGERHTVDFTENGGLDWNGWRYVTADLPQGVPQPYTLKTIYAAQTNEANKQEGTLYFSGLQAVTESREVARFPDAADHWAASAVLRLNDRGTITGFMDGTFQPEGSVTREQTAAMLVRELQLPEADNDRDFTDVSESRMMYDHIQRAQEAGLIEGDPEGTFRPSDSLTRAELSAVLVRAFTFSGSDETSFPDVSESHWGYEDIQRLASAGLAGGYEDGTFRPDRAVTRAEFSTLLDRIEQRSASETEED